MTWWIVGGVVLVVLVALAVRVVVAVWADERRTVSWWAARNGFRYTRGTSRLLGHLRGRPFNRGTNQDVHDVLAGRIAGRPALIIQFSWFLRPTGGGARVLNSGICSAAVLDLPAPVPELVVDKERGLGRDLQLESEEFNAAFRITGAHDRFSYDVLNPRVMAWLLGKRGYAFRLGGSTLAVWRDGPLTGTRDLGEVRDFAATLFGMIPSFVYTAGYPATATPTIAEIPAGDLGPPPVGALHVMQHLTHRGHDVERYENVVKRWGVTESVVNVKINVPVPWPVLTIVPARIVHRKRPTFFFVDAVTSGHRSFDARYLCGSPRPDFAALALTEEVTGLLLAGQATDAAAVTFQSEELTPENDGVPERVRRGGLWVTAPGELADQALADRLTELACDLVEALPDAVLRYRVDDPV